MSNNYQIAAIQLSGHLPLGWRWQRRLVILVLLMLSFSGTISGQKMVELKYRGQFSTWGGYSSGSEWPVMLGARYLPQLNLDITTDMEAPGRGGR